MFAVVFKSVRCNGRVVEYDKRCRRAVDNAMHEHDADIMRVVANRVSGSQWVR